MVFRERGFLSPNAKVWARRIRAAHGPRFELAERVSVLGQRMVPLLEGKTKDTQTLLSGALFLRGLQSLQAAVILAERGMTIEVGMLTRNSYETLLCLGCSVRDPGFYKRLGFDHLARTNTV